MTSADTGEHDERRRQCDGVGRRHLSQGALAPQRPMHHQQTRPCPAARTFTMAMNRRPK